MPTIKRYDVEQWIKTIATGEFHYSSVCGLRGKLDPEDDNKLRGIIWTLCHDKEPIIESVGKHDGYYRTIQDLPTPIDWQNVDAKRDFPIILPFDLRKYVWIDPNTSIVVAGSKDSGKTGFCIRVVVLNMNKVKVIFLTNMEGGVNQVKRRFEAIGVDMVNPPFVTYCLIDNFHDAIRQPDTLYVIDYIDVPESGEYYMIAPALAKIQSKITTVAVNSVAVIGLQKKTSSDIAYGGEPTLKKTGLYLAMNPGKLKIVSAKIAADKKIDPKNMQWTFKYSDEGTAFTDIKPYYGEIG